MALILRYFAEFGSLRGALGKKWLKVSLKKFTFAISSPDEFLLLHAPWSGRFPTLSFATLRKSRPILSKV